MPGSRLRGGYGVETGGFFRAQSAGCMAVPVDLFEAQPVVVPQVELVGAESGVVCRGGTWQREDGAVGPVPGVEVWSEGGGATEAFFPQLVEVTAAGRGAAVVGFHDGESGVAASAYHGEGGRQRRCCGSAVVVGVGATGGAAYEAVVVRYPSTQPGGRATGGEAAVFAKTAGLEHVGAEQPDRAAAGGEEEFFGGLACRAVEFPKGGTCSRGIGDEVQGVGTGGVEEFEPSEVKGYKGAGFVAGGVEDDHAGGTHGAACSLDVVEQGELEGARTGVDGAVGRSGIDGGGGGEPVREVVTAAEGVVGGGA